MAPWIGHLLAAMFGALITAVTFYVTLAGRVSDVEAQQKALRSEMKDLKDRVDDRVYHVEEAAARVITLGEKILEQNNLLIAEIRADRRKRGDN